MRRRKAIQTITLGIGGFGLLNYCTSSPKAYHVLEEKNQKLVALLTEAILPAKSEEFLTPESRMEFILNQIGGNISEEDFMKGVDFEYRRLYKFMIETINKLNRVSRQMMQDMGREPTPEELSKELDMPEDKVRKVLKIAKEPISTETPIGDDEDSSLGDFIEDTVSGLRHPSRR